MKTEFGGQVVPKEPNCETDFKTTTQLKDDTVHYWTISNTRLVDSLTDDYRRLEVLEA